jgi:hypothetical protein
LELTFDEALEYAHSDPCVAIALLWHYLVSSHRSFEEGFDRNRCELEADLFRTALDTGDDLPTVHPAAALRALSDYLYDLDSGSVPRVQLAATPHGGFWVVPRRPGWTSRFSVAQAGHLEYWLRWHHVVPVKHSGIDVRVVAAPKDFRRPRAKPMTFLAGGFLDEVLPKWSHESPFRCEVLTAPDTRWSSVHAMLKTAAAEGVAIVVMPELTVDASVRLRIRDWLKSQARGSSVVLVVAGSFHETVSGRKRNVAYVFDGDGEEALRHVKLRPMRAIPKEKIVDEDIEGGSEVQLMHTWFGLMGVAICLDFCETGGAPVATLWPTVGPALMLVPSMGGDTTNSAHRDRALDLLRQHGTATIVASQHPEEAVALGLYWSETAVRGEAHPTLQELLPWTGD